MSAEPQSEASAEPREHSRFPWLTACAVLTVTLLPYLFGAPLVGAHPSRGWFSWLGYNLDDGCVYLSWMRQAADGHLFQRNLFTTEPQAGHQVNLLFLLLGNIARFTHLPLLAVWHGARIVLGLVLLRAVWWLIGIVVPVALRRTALIMVAVSAGLGWVPGLWQDYGLGGPVDTWQTEAITFLSLYLNPLNLAALLLMVLLLGNLLQATAPNAQRPTPSAVKAASAGFLLGNIHAYDVITLILVWTSWLVVRSVAERRAEVRAWGISVLVAVPMLLSTGYVYYQLKHDPIFAQRVAVETTSFGPHTYLLGYGLLIPLAVVGVRAFRRSAVPQPNAQTPERLNALFLATWCIANLAAAYLPVPYQRKMILGEHIPLAILAAVGLTRLVAGQLSIVNWTPVRRAILAVLLALLALTNLRFLLRDVQGFQDNRAQSGIQRPYLYSGEAAALEWLRQHAPPGAPIQPLPWVRLTPERKIAMVDTTVAALAPGLTDHPVIAGHWGETPAFWDTMKRWVDFIKPTTSDEQRRELLRSSGVRYLIFTQKHPDEAAGSEELLAFFRGAPPVWLRLVPEASNGDADVYEVAL